MEGLKANIMNIINLALLTVLLLRTYSVDGYVMTRLVPQKSTLVTDIPGSEYYPKTSEAEAKYYKILEIHKHGAGSHMYVGGRNVLTELSERNLSLVRELGVQSSTFNLPPGAFDCPTLKGDNIELYCQFYVTFVQELNDTTSILCGTNALYPRCDTFKTGAMSLNDSTSWDARGLTAAVPDQPTSTLVIPEGDDLVVYAGAPIKREDNFAFIRKIIGPDGETKESVMTDDTDSDWIVSGSSNSPPSFIGDPIRYNGKIYFFFREEAVEAKNVEKVVYSRVGQVCENDEGGQSGVLNGKWTTFLKARLSCSTQGNVKIFFDNLQSTYRSKENSNIIFGIFTTPSSSIPASALCAYDLAEIEELFAGSAFKNQANSNSLWLNVAAGDVPTPRPGTCTETMPVVNYDSLDSIQLMSSLVPNKANYTTARTWTSSMESDYPIMILLGHWLRHIVVQENSSSGPDVFFFGTDKGQIFQSYIYNSAPRIVDEVKLTVNGAAEEKITSLRISDDGATLYASTSSRIYRLPAVNCARFLTCQECVEGLDPACSWVSSGEDTGCKAAATGIRDLANGDTGPCPAASSAAPSVTMPATPASKSTAEPEQSSEGTTDSGKESTPKQGQSHTGTGTTGSGTPPSSSSPFTTDTTIATTTYSSPPQPSSQQPPDTQGAPDNVNSTMDPPCGCQLVCGRTDIHMCYPWILSSVLLVCFCNVPACIGIFVCCKKRRSKYHSGSSGKYSSPIKRNTRDASQKVPLKAVSEPHSENDEDEDVDEAVPMTEAGRKSNANNTPHKETIIDEVKNSHNKKNGTTPTSRTPVRGTTVSSSDV